MSNHLTINQHERHKNFKGLFKVPMTANELSSLRSRLTELKAHGLALTKTGRDLGNSLTPLERFSGVHNRSAKAGPQKMSPVGKRLA